MCPVAPYIKDILRYFRPIYLEECLKTDTENEKPHTKPGMSAWAAVAPWHCLKSEAIFGEV